MFGCQKDSKITPLYCRFLSSKVKHLQFDICLIEPIKCLFVQFLRHNLCKSKMKQLVYYLRDVFLLDLGELYLFIDLTLILNALELQLVLQILRHPLVVNHFL